jgi:hypothetical protein
VPAAPANVIFIPAKHIAQLLQLDR